VAKKETKNIHAGIIMPKIKRSFTLTPLSFLVRKIGKKESQKGDSIGYG